jgi:hypothetical protein
MDTKEQLKNFRSRLIQVIREAVEKESGCIGTFYKNRGSRYYLCPEKEEYDDSPIVVVHNSLIDMYGGFVAATVFDLYEDTGLRLMCTINSEAGEDWDEPLERVQTEGLIEIAKWLQKQGFVSENKDNPYRCRKCGSKNVQRMAWVHPNEDNRLDEYTGYCDEEEENWCDKCEEYVELMPEDEFMNEIEAWRQKSGYREAWEGLMVDEKIEIWNLNKEKD